jgi:hypothetical protein
MVKVNHCALKEVVDLVSRAMPREASQKELEEFKRTDNRLLKLRVSTFGKKLLHGFRKQVCLFMIFISCSSLHSFAGEMEHITVYRDDTLYLIIPWLLQLNNGDLVLTAREAHARNKEQRGHVDPTARGILLRSRDGGPLIHDHF